MAIPVFFAPAAAAVAAAAAALEDSASAIGVVEPDKVVTSVPEAVTIGNVSEVGIPASPASPPLKPLPSETEEVIPRFDGRLLPSLSLSLFEWCDRLPFLEDRSFSDPDPDPRLEPLPVPVTAVGRTFKISLSRCLGSAGAGGMLGAATDPEELGESAEAK